MDVRVASSAAATNKKCYKGEIHMSRLYPKKAMQSQMGSVL
jgi:hypothetical protein